MWGSCSPHLGGFLFLPFDAVVAAAVCAAGMALGDIDLHFAAGVALADIDLHFAWQVWHLRTSTFTLRGRCGTYGTGLPLVARLGPVWRRCRRGCLRGRRSAWWHQPALPVAGVALADIDRHFAWQVWLMAWWSVPARLGTPSRSSCRSPLFMAWGMFCVCGATQRTHTAYTHTHSHTYPHTYIYIYIYKHIPTYKQLSHTQVFHIYIYIYLSFTISSLFSAFPIPSSPLFHTIFHTQLGHTCTIFHKFCHTHTHTRQEWIIIWSGRNWILKHANQLRSLDL